MSRVSSPGRAALLTSVALSAAPFVHAESLIAGAPENLEVSAGGGLRYEDNLVVESLDVSSAQSDVAAVAKLDLGYDKDEAWGETDLRSGYSLEDRRYFEEKDFNLQVHYGYLDLSREVFDLTAGAMMDATYARVGGSSLLNSQKLTGYVTDLVTRQLYVRGSVGLERTTIEGNEGRDNNGQRLDGSAFYFLDGTEQYLTAKARFSREQADNDVFDYQAERISLGYVQRLGIPEQWPVRVRADWRYEMRRYGEFDPGLGVKRQDFRQRWRLRLDAPVTDAVSLQLKVEHRNYNSNNPALDFDDNRIQMLVDVALI